MNIASASSGQCQIYRKAEIVVGVWPNRDLMCVYIYYMHARPILHHIGMHMRASTAYNFMQVYKALRMSM